MINTFKSFVERIWSYFPLRFSLLDSNKELDPLAQKRGLFERFIKSFGSEIDEDVYPYIEEFTKLLDLLATKEDGNYYADDRFLAHFAYTLGRPELLCIDSEGYRQLLTHILTIYKVKGTKKAYKAFFKFLGFNAEIYEYPLLPPFKYDTPIRYDVDPEIGGPYYDRSICDPCSFYDLLISLDTGSDACSTPVDEIEISYCYPEKDSNLAVIYVKFDSSTSDSYWRIRDDQGNAIFPLSTIADSPPLISSGFIQAGDTNIDTFNNLSSALTDINSEYSSNSYLPSSVSQEQENIFRLEVDKSLLGGECRGVELELNPNNPPPIYSDNLLPANFYGSGSFESEGGVLSSRYFSLLEVDSSGIHSNNGNGSLHFIYDSALSTDNPRLTIVPSPLFSMKRGEFARISGYMKFRSPVPVIDIFPTIQPGYRIDSYDFSSINSLGYNEFEIIIEAIADVSPKIELEFTNNHNFDADIDDLSVNLQTNSSYIFSDIIAQPVCDDCEADCEQIESNKLEYLYNFSEVENGNSITIPEIGVLTNTYYDIDQFINYVANTINSHLPFLNTVIANNNGNNILRVLLDPEWKNGTFNGSPITLFDDTQFPITSPTVNIPNSLNRFIEPPSECEPYWDYSVAYFEYLKSFPNQVSFIPDNYSRRGEIIGYYWDFGDGNTSVEEEPTHTYQEPGNYLVTYYTFTNKGLPAIHRKVITINDTTNVEIYDSRTYLKFDSQYLTYDIYPRPEINNPNDTINGISNLAADPNYRMELEYGTLAPFEISSDITGVMDSVGTNILTSRIYGNNNDTAILNFTVNNVPEGSGFGLRPWTPFPCADIFTDTYMRGEAQSFEDYLDSIIHTANTYQTSWVKYATRNGNEFTFVIKSDPASVFNHTIDCETGDLYDIRYCPWGNEVDVSLNPPTCNEDSNLLSENITSLVIGDIQFSYIPTFALLSGELGECIENILCQIEPINAEFNNISSKSELCENLSVYFCEQLTFTIREDIYYDTGHNYDEMPLKNYDSNTSLEIVINEPENCIADCDPADEDVEIPIPNQFRLDPYTPIVTFC